MTKLKVVSMRRAASEMAWSEVGWRWKSKAANKNRESELAGRMPQGGMR